jgi:hypothetical protein
LNDQNYNETLPIRINIWNFPIPYTRHLRTRYGGCSNTPSEIEDFLYHRVNSDGIGIAAILNESTDSWEFNWTEWDKNTAYILSQGQNSFGVGTGVGIWPYLDDLQYKNRMQDYLRQVQVHLNLKNWSQYAYIYFIDEFSLFTPSGYTRAQWLQNLSVVMSWMQEAAPDIKILAVSPPYDDVRYYMDDYIGIYCPATYDYDRTVWNNELAEGKEMWYYTCVGPLAPYPNNHLYDRLYEGRLLSWQLWYYGIYGNLGWDVHTGIHGGYALGFNGWADGVFIFIENNQRYDSIRWENVLQGIQDYEYCWILNSTLNYVDHHNLLPQNLILQYRYEFSELVGKITGESWTYTNHVGDLYYGHQRIGEFLNELSKVVDISKIAEQKINWQDLSLEILN